MTPSQEAFHLEEFKLLHGEIAALLGRVETLFRYSLLVSALVYSWLVTQSVGITPEAKACLKLPFSLLWPGWLIPPTFVLVTGVLAAAAYVQVLQMGKYLRLVEAKLARPALGWEKFLKKKGPIVTGTTATAWMLLLVACIAASSTGISVLNRQSKVVCESVVRF